MRFTMLSLSALVALSACSDVEEEPSTTNEEEVITTVTLTFTPVGGGSGLVFTWADPENDGSPVIDPILLPDASTHDHHDELAYTLSVAFLNELEDPAEDITVEVADESDQHQVFFTGSGVEGPATGANPDAVITQAYADADANGLPVGLESDVTTANLGSGELTVTLRHMPPEADQAVKVDGAAELVATDGWGAIGGDDDASVTFPITVE